MNLVKHDGEVYEVVDGLYKGLVPAPIPDGPAPSIQWAGPKLPYHEWCQFVSYGRWMMEKHKCEAQARLYYRDGQPLRLVVFPQTGQGLSTHDNLSHELAVPIIEVLDRDGWQPCGTIHTHERASAFQSGTDKANEKNQSGLHVTLGELHKDTVDIHSRIVFRGTEYASDMVTLLDWVETPEFHIDLEMGAWSPPRSMINEFLKRLPTMSLATPPQTAPPKEWEDMYVRREEVITHIAVSPMPSLSLGPSISTTKSNLETALRHERYTASDIASISSLFSSIGWASGSKTTSVAEMIAIAVVANRLHKDNFRIELDDFVCDDSTLYDIELMLGMIELEGQDEVKDSHWRLGF